jgi:hypothetical protein
MDRTQKIAELNDRLRRQAGLPLFFTPVNGRIVVTAGISALDPADQIEIMARVRAFDAFGEDNDPHAERNFGGFVHEAGRFFWKIDYYAPDLIHGSEDPADDARTIRVLTVMLAEEY